MRFSLKKLAISLAMLCLLAAGAALPASAQAAAIQLPDISLPDISLPSISWPWQSGSTAIESLAAGDYASTMTVGQTQQLSPVASPEGAGGTISFASENESVATVSSSGTVQAVAAGTVRICASAGDAAVYYTITVQTDPSTWVSEMDITLSASQIAVDGTATVSVQVLPSDATNTDQLTLTSSNTSVATVNRFGKVTGIAPGTAVITAACGSVSASAKITVLNSSSGSGTVETIELNTTYVVLKPGSTASLKATVSPSSASQSITYKTSNSSVAAVSPTGIITAMGTGSTSIIVSNGTASALVTVIVNQSASASGSDSGSDTPADDPAISADPVVQAIESAAGDEVTLPQSDVPTLTAEMLNALHSSGKTLILTADTYTLRIRGSQISNASSPLATAITFTAADNGVEFSLNTENGTLPGDVEITLTGEEGGYSRLYLYNSASGKWQYLNSYSDGAFTADTAGRYLLTNETLNTIQVNWYFLGAAGVVVAAIVVVYIVFKKRYWFW